MSLPLTKCWDEGDFPELARELAVVDEHFEGATAQASLRRWEYAMAIRAIDQWSTLNGANPHVILDVGGAGSPFSLMRPATVIDPTATSSDACICTLAEYLSRYPRIVPAVMCLSVLEHVATDLNDFLYHLSCLVAPGGLLFFTMDASPDAYPADDVYHWHWMRERIFSRSGRIAIWQALRRYDLELFGDAEWDFVRPYENWGYAAASLALIRRS